MSNMTRKDFIRTGLSAVAAAGLPPLAMANAVPRPTQAPVAKDAALIETLNPVLRLYPDKAVERSGDIRFGTAELRVMLPFFGAGQVVWNVTAPESGSYDVALCYSCTRAGTQLKISNGTAEIQQATQVTEGYWYPDPKGAAANPGDPDSDSFWSMREFYSFERVPLNQSLQLTRGMNVIRLQVTAPKGKEIFRLRSIELTPVSQRNALAADREQALRHRANTDWFARAGYGMWFHYLDLTEPRHGARKPYKDAVNALDVKKLAKLVDDCGARYLILTVNHGNPTCPAPIESWEALHPGWTTRRDLIGELADALGRHGIKLMLYMNCPGLGNLVQLNGGAVDQPSVSEEEYARRLITVFEEFGRRYGDKVVGYWLDSWFQTIESYPNLPFEKLNAAVKSGNRDCMIAYNHWAFPSETPWQDYWAGELTDLPLKPFKSRHVTRGAGQGLQAHAAMRLDDPWFHIKSETEIEAPRYTAAELAEYIKSCKRDQAPVTLGVGIYQDGTIGPRSLAVLKELRQLVGRS